MYCAIYSVFAAWVVTFMLVTAVAGQACAGEVWATNEESANVTVINPDSMIVVATIPAGKGAHGVTFSNDGKLAFVANTRANNVTIIDAVGKNFLGTVATGRKAHQVSISPDGMFAVTSNSGTDFVTLIDVKAMKAVGAITTGYVPVRSVFSPDGTKLYVVNNRSANVSVIDMESRQVSGTIPVGEGMDLFLPTSDWSQAWGTWPNENKIRLIDLVKGEIVTEILVPGAPHGLAMSHDGGLLYVVQQKLNQIAVVNISSRMIAKTVLMDSVGYWPDMVEISPDGESIFVTVVGTDKLVKLSVSDLRVEGVAETGDRPHGVAYRP